MAEEVKTTEEVVVNNNGNGTEVGSKEESTLTPPVVKSGLARSLEKYKITPSVGEEKETKPAAVSSFDYAVLKDLDEKDYEKYKDIKGKDESLYYELLSQRNDMKKHQRLASQYQNEAKSKSVLPEDVQKMKDFVEGLKTDSIGAYKRFQKDFDLPEIEFFEKQIASGGGVEDRLVQWQESELIPKIEKKFKIESGTFVYDANEAYKAGTPSYEYRIQTEKQEQSLLSEYEGQAKRQSEVLTKVKQQNDVDLKFLRETYYPDKDFAELDEKGNIVNVEAARQKADEAFMESLNQLDEIQKKNREGEFDPTLNPFALRTIWRGLNHDKLVETAVNKAVQNLHTQYNAKGLYLKNEDMPTDATKAKGTANVSSEQPKKFGVLHQRIKQTLSQ